MSVIQITKDSEGYFVVKHPEHEGFFLKIQMSVPVDQKVKSILESLFFEALKKSKPKKLGGVWLYVCEHEKTGEVFHVSNNISEMPKGLQNYCDNNGAKVLKTIYVDFDVEEKQISVSEMRNFLSQNIGLYFHPYKRSEVRNMQEIFDKFLNEKGIKL